MANLNDFEEGESGEESEPCVDELVDDGESEGDMPNIAADSSGNTLHGFNLRALQVGPMPPTPSDHSGDDSSSSGDHSDDCDDGENVASLVTPPPKRHATTVPDESSIKVRKLEKNMKTGGGGAELSKPIAAVKKEPMEKVSCLRRGRVGWAACTFSDVLFAICVISFCFFKQSTKNV